MRLSALILLATALAFPAAAQPDLDILHAENRLAARQEMARQRSLAADREALALETRARTAATLFGLRRQRPPVEMTPDMILDPQLAAEIEAVATLQAKALAESNARILAIKPAGED